MTRKTVVDMRRLFELKRKGYSMMVIAKVLGVSIATIRTIAGGVEKEAGRRQGCATAPYLCPRVKPEVCAVLNRLALRASAAKRQ